MREILFRGKRVDNGEWVYGVPIKATLNCYEERTEIATTIEYETDIEFSTYVEGETVIPETIGQYTGLKDKNGTKIFEGDIAKDNYGNIYRIIFSDMGYFCAENYIFWEFITDLGEIEVIGNIHDNPELWKGDKE